MGRSQAVAIHHDTSGPRTQLLPQNMWHLNTAVCGRCVVRYKHRFLPGIPPRPFPARKSGGNTEKRRIIDKSNATRKVPCYRCVNMGYNLKFVDTVADTHEQHSTIWLINIFYVNLYFKLSVMYYLHVGAPRSSSVVPNPSPPAQPCVAAPGLVAAIKKHTWNQNPNIKWNIFSLHARVMTFFKL